MRARKPKNLEQKMARYASSIIDDASTLRGSWASKRNPAFAEVRLDLGCGKGSYLVQAAMREPDVLFVGLDLEQICLVMAAQKAEQHRLSNIMLARGDAADLGQMFAPGELSTIYLNFSTPWPKTKQARRRLTHADNLVGYRGLLSPGGHLRIKTDSQPLFDFTLTQLAVAGYEVEWQTRDLHALAPDEPTSDFESRLMAKGAQVHALSARKAALDAHAPNTAPMGLVAYLPDDLDAMDYVPHGMEDTVQNMKNRRDKLKRGQGC